MLLAKVRRARVVGRGVDRDEELGARQRLERPRARRVPDVLADVDGEGRLARGEDGGVGAGLEVAVLVEDAVVRQVSLVVNARARAVVEHGRGVEDVVALVDEADDRGDPARGARDVAEGGEVRLDERRLEEGGRRRGPGEPEPGPRPHTPPHPPPPPPPPPPLPPAPPT